MPTKQKPSTINHRLHVLRFCIIVALILLTSRLFYWQIIDSQTLKATASSQRSSTLTVQGQRGNILASDGFALVTNTPTYLAYAYTPQLEIPTFSIAQQLAPVFIDPHPSDATEAAKPLSDRISHLQAELDQKLSTPDKKWIPLQRNLSKEAKEKVDQLKIIGIGFDETEKRYYPEASMSAHLLGFVSLDENGDRRGYFGLEGYYNQDLQGRSGKIYQETDAAGRPIIIGDFTAKPSRPGRTLQLYLDRALQHMVEDNLQQGLEKYQAASGEVILMDPYTGGILAMASLPAYDPGNFAEYETSRYKNPIIANLS